jgi:ATP-dependent DNA helicase RecQ
MDNDTPQQPLELRGLQEPKNAQEPQETPTKQAGIPTNCSIEVLIERARSDMGLSYLFPYQRLVIANILEAARTAGIPFMPQGEGPQVDEQLRNAGLQIDEMPQDAGPQIDGLPQDAEPQIDERLQDKVARSDEVPKDMPNVDGVPPDPDREAWSGYGRQIVILPTGAGKSLCFQLPARVLARPTLVVFPILALMADQERRLRSQGIPVVLLRGNQSQEEREAIARALEKPANTFIIANPEVLQTAPVRRLLTQAQIAHVVIDEAHCVSQWGESFRPAYLELGKILADLKAPLLTAFTATASPQVLEKIRHYLFHDEAAHLVMGNPDRPNISYRICRTLAKESALRHLLRLLPRPSIVFCSSRSRTEQLARSLRYTLGTRDIYFYHAGLEREEKKAVEDWFFSSSTGILVATCAYGMGVDKSNIRTVIHFDCPDLVEAYLQEAGRAGRDGKAATAVLLWGPEDEASAGPMTEYGKNTACCRRELLLSLLTGLQHSEQQRPAATGRSDEHDVATGRRDGDDAVTGLSGEDDTASEPGHGPATCTGDEHSCDICSGTAPLDWREAQALVRLIHQNPRFFTLSEAADWVSRQAPVDLSREEARRTFLALLQEGRLRYSRNLLWKGRLVAR